MDRTDWDARYAAADLVWSAEPNRFLVAEVSGLPPAAALDVACGEGRNAIWLAEQGWKVTAVDFSEVAIGKARRLAEHRRVGVDWVVADVTTWEPPGTYQLIIVMYLHLPTGQMRDVVVRSARHLDPGGTVLVVGHHVDNLTDGWGGPRDRSILHDPAVIAGWLQEAGLEIERAARVDRPVETPDGPRVALDSLVRAHRP